MMEGGMRVAFRTKSEVEILDDGFKWRKYGKKSVKNNSHPRYVIIYKLRLMHCILVHAVLKEEFDLLIRVFDYN